jgi:integrase
VQRRLVQLKYCRRIVNSHLGRIKRLFRWASKCELIPPAVYHGLAAVEGLRQGRSGAQDYAPIEPVPWSQVELVLPFLSPPVAAMVEVQFLCGMRPAEVCIVRRADIDTSGEFWIYTPVTHKNAWRNQLLVKAIPARAQAILRRFFKPEAEAYLFSPRDAVAWLSDRRAAAAGKDRTTQAYPSELRRRIRARAATRRRAPIARDHYDTHAYRRAIAYGIAAARRAHRNVTDWSPNQLRHAIATAVAQQLDYQAAQRWLGHKSLATTGIYVEQQLADLMAIAREVDRQFAG